MDRRSIIGFVLIGVVLMFWLYWNTSKTPPPQPKKQDTVKVETKQSTDTNKAPITSIPTTKDSITNSLGSIFSKSSTAGSSDTLKDSSHTKPVGEKIIQVENKKVALEFTNYGGTVKKITLKDFQTWDKNSLQLVNWKKGKELHLIFTSKDGKQINTANLIFEADYKEWDKINIEDKKDFVLKYTLNITPDGSQKIVKNYTFKPDSYEFDVTYELFNSDKFITGSKYQVAWETSLNLTEHRSDDEATFAEAFALMGSDIEQLDATKFDEPVKADFTGNTKYVASRNKYFGVYIIPDGVPGDGAYLTGSREHLPDNGVKENYSIAVKKDIKADNYEKATFRILVTPLEYGLLKAYGLDLEKSLRFTLDFLVRPIAQYLIIPFFTFLHSFIPNYGLVIIIFAIVLKILLNPLTKSQMKSMKKMGTLGPKMTAIREKYKDDPVKANQQIMKLYKEEKINPAGGCLPMLLQLPILYALFGVFRSTIELRGAPFIWWIHDLAAPDVIFHLPFTIPLFGISDVSGLATLMGITMFIQQKMTVTDPKQKALVYVMPIMMTLLFFSFPAGLNLYYFVFNLLSIIQQYFTNKKDKEKENAVTVVQTGKSPVKK
ncbi:MAG: membrane protein insertase YidC [Ignavibacteria bacterium]|nr:membrane protein insertase YidC [Ignavibacteria bacterium]